ncbi:hypothetical protein N7535_007662 [Penicillium sp. DV-2018c]|nr:hypothetical protein N7535_007662 [Penicillium sp. DV-2018c]
MLLDRALLRPAKLDADSTLFASKSEQPHDLVVVYSSRERKWDVQQYRQEQHQAFSTTTVPAAESGQIVFIRGFISPSWVSAIGSKYEIDPEFFSRHMDYLSASVARHSYSFPSLASSSNNIVRLCVSTLLYRDGFGGQDLQSQRSLQATELGQYRLRHLASTKISCGDSVSLPGWTKVDPWKDLPRDRGQVTSNLWLHHYPSFNTILKWHFGPRTTG